MAQYPASAVNPFRLVTKADTASAIALATPVTVSANSGIVGTYGSWTQVLASTSAESYVTELGITIPSTNTPVVADCPITVQLGLGAGGSEAVVFERLIPFTTFTANHVYLVRLDIPLRATASKRLAARLKISTTTVVDLKFTIFGLPISQTEGN